MDAGAWVPAELGDERLPDALVEGAAAEHAALRVERGGRLSVDCAVGERGLGEYADLHQELLLELVSLVPCAHNGLLASKLAT